MRKTKSGSHSRWTRLLSRACAVGAGLLLTLGGARAASAQAAGRVTVTGRVTSPEGAPVQGVAVTAQGSDSRALTGPDGRYILPNVPPDATLSFALVGRRPTQIALGGRTTVDVTMERVAYLEEVVTTGYTTETRATVTGAVASVPIETMNRQTGASALQKLAAATPGVTVENSGSPGGRSTVRIRGISSFQNNDPLYIIDGTPVQDSYINWLNPEDITSIQVLKDASAASIYGARASNGVIVIETTKKGLVSPPRTNFRIRTGWAQPTRGYDDFLILNSLDYFKVVRASFQNAGQPTPVNIYGDSLNPSVPAYIWPNNCGTTGVCSTVDPSTYSYPGNLIMRGSPGTNWWKAVFGTGRVNDANLDVSGGSADNTYGVSFNLYDQQGTARYNEFKRGTVRANTEFRRKKLSFGENLAVGIERAFGGVGGDDLGEGGILGKNILMQPVVPVYDIAGNFASGKPNTLGNNTNPLRVAYESRNNVFKTNRIFGNVFGGYQAIPALQLRSRLGFNVGQQFGSGYTFSTPENHEVSSNNGISEYQWQSSDWTWSNTATYAYTYRSSTLNLLAGQEANAGNFRRMDGSLGNLLNTAVESRFLQDALGDANTKNVTSSGSRYALLSLFGKADLNVLDRYVLSATVRRDGSSRLGPANRWGTFPAFGVNWHISNESFLQGNPWINDAMLRYGWGVTGNQQITPGRIVSQFSGERNVTFYDIKGSNNTLATGYRQRSLGNPNLKWEEDRSQNVGTDLSLWDNRINVVLDVYRRTTDNVLFDPRLPATAGRASPPIVNVGSMRNTGFDLSIGHRSASWNATLNGSHYKNEILRISGGTQSFFGPVGLRFSPRPVINQVGQPIGMFYGYVFDGFFNDSASAANSGQAGAKPGRIRFKDINGDGKITGTDQTTIGSPHPKFTAGLDLGARWRAFDVAATLFGSYGNKILDAQKQFYIFRNFDTNVRKDLLAESWTPTHMNAKYPRLDALDTYSSAVSSFYVEDGSYTRLRSLQIGYTIPGDIAYLSRALTGARIYFQGDNVFTLTHYQGLDPALPAGNANGAAGDIRDQYRGIDQGAYPSNRIFSIGVTTSF
ncbi:MAG TPA: SusC/RagA family TonB-linked outer membrane protein [Gemmatimonadaceae bacterium]|nr:SusC/RagA family TonB-linked outer membrane protein [Gemmatimonadaceae bacterium]